MSKSNCQNCRRTKSLWSRSYNCTVCKQKTCESCLIPENSLVLFNIHGICLRCHKILTEDQCSTSLPSELDINENSLKYLSIIQRDPFLDFDNVSHLGSGTFSKVFRVKQKNTNKEFALKQMESSKCSQMQANNEFIQTVACNSENLVKNFALYYYDQKYFILQELMHSTIRDYIINNESIPEDVCLYIIKETLQGLNYLHKDFIIHRDIKSENLYISFDGQVKVGDFGTVAQLTQEKELRETLAGTPLYLAPEVVKGERYSTKVDIWAIGIVAYELVYKQPLFADSKNFAELFPRIKNFSNSDITSFEYSKVDEVVRVCLNSFPANRPTCLDLLNSSLFQINSEACKGFIMDYVKR